MRYSLLLKMYYNINYLLYVSIQRNLLNIRDAYICKLGIVVNKIELYLGEYKTQ